MPWRLRVFTTCVILGWAAAASTARAAVARVALLAADDRNPRIGQLIALAEVEIAQQGNLQLVERRQIDQVLREQRLSLTGTIDAEQAVKAGRILSADLIAAVEADKESPAVGLVVFDASTGIRLLDEGITALRDADCATSLARGVAAAATKRTRGHMLRMVCLLTVRNADMPRGMDGFCDGVGKLVERALVGSPSVAVLERSRLEQVTRERALAAEARYNDLLGSLVVISIDVGRDGPGFRATAMLNDIAGGPLGTDTVSTKTSDGAALAGAIADALAARLRAPAAARPDLRAEAARFHREAVLRIDHSDYLHAIPAAEAANALAPDDVVYASDLARCLVCCGSNLFVEPWNRPRKTNEPVVEDPKAVPTVARGATLMSEVVARASAAGTPPAVASNVCDSLIATIPRLREYILLSTHLQIGKTEATPAPGEDLAAAKSAMRDFLLWQNARVAAAVHDEGSFFRYCEDVASLLTDNEWEYSRDSTEWTTDWERTATRWIEARVRFRGDRSGAVKWAMDTMTWTWLIERHQTRTLYTYGQQRSRRWDPDEAGYARLERLRRRLADAPDPLLNEYANLFALAIQIAQERGGPAGVRALVRQFAAAELKRLSDPGVAGTPATRQSIYWVIADADSILDRTGWAGEVSVEAADVMLARHDIEPTLLYRAINGIPGAPQAREPDHDPLARQAAWLKRIIDVLDQPNRVILADQPDRVERQFRSRENELRNQVAGKPTGPPATQPWREARALIDVFNAKSGIYWVLRPLVADKDVYAIGLSHKGYHDPITLELLRIPLSGGEGHGVQRLGSLPHRWPIDRQPPETRGRHIVSGTLTGACRADGLYCATTASDGVFVFPTNGQPARLLDERAGLPSSSGQAVAVMGGAIYAALGKPGTDAYFVSYDLANSRCDVIASSIRKERRSPFDDNGSFVVRAIVADPPRKRLIVAVEDLAPNDGLWEYRPSTRQWKLLLPLRLTLSTLRRANLGIATPLLQVDPLRHEQLLVRTNCGALVYDLPTDLAEKLMERPFTNYPPPFPPGLPRYAAETDAGEAAITDRDLRRFGEVTLNDGWLWISSAGEQPWGRIHLADGRRESFGPLRNNGLPFTMIYLVPTADPQTLVVGDTYALWALRMGDSKHE